jgi:hypothetical protein
MMRAASPAILVLLTRPTEPALCDLPALAVGATAVIGLLALERSIVATLNPDLDNNTVESTPP